MKALLTGIQELAAKDYHLLDAINASGLKELKKSPAHYKQSKLEIKEPTPAMILGSATHAAVLEPELFYKDYFARPDGIDGRTKEGKAQLAEIGKANTGKTMLSFDDFQRVEAMMKAVRNNPIASQLISGGKPEMSMIWQDTNTGVLCKARPDYIRGDDILVDIKTCESAAFREFGYDVRKYSMHLQAAWYLSGINHLIGKEQYTKFVLVAVEKTAPFELIAYELDQEGIRIGAIECEDILNKYAECKSKDVWPGYPQTIHTMTLPEWKQ